MNMLITTYSCMYRENLARIVASLSSHLMAMLRSLLMVAAPNGILLSSSLALNEATVPEGVF